VDESWAIAQRDDGRLDRPPAGRAGLLLLVSWTAGTAIGDLRRRPVADPESLGLDAAFPALFLALLWPRSASAPASWPPWAAPPSPWPSCPSPAPGSRSSPPAWPASSARGGPDERRLDQRAGGRPGHHRHQGRRSLSCSPAAPRHPAPRPPSSTSAPALLAALVVTQALGGDNGGFTVDARLAGLAAGAAALLLRAPLLAVITAAAVTAALVRLVA
jgi:hypothetical protein